MTRHNLNPYNGTDKYTVLKCDNRTDWLQARKDGIGGSDASAFMGCGWKSLRDVWLSKREPVNHVLTKAMEYGIKCESDLRDLFCAKHLELIPYYEENTILKSMEHEWAFYSPDGLLYDEVTKQYGILEIKTHSSKGYADDMDLWGTVASPRIPEPYYWQIIHGLLVTGFDFVYVSCEIRYEWSGESKIITRRINRENVEADIKTLLETEHEYIKKYFASGIIPPMTFSL